jgi:predicted AlkP superfamily pyrophosphatase or phosphodiesterase
VAAYERLAGKDAQEGEWEPPDIVFPHAPRGKPPEEQFYSSLRRTPYADELTLDLALKALDAYALGRRGVTDMLFVGFSSLDGVGHTFGPQSQEAMDTVLRLDRVLQRLFDAAGAASGGRALIVLGADHGSMPLVELLKERGLDARRVRPAVLEEAVAKALQARFPQASGLVAHYDTPNFYLDVDAIERQGLRRAEVEAAIGDAVMSTGLALRVYTHASFLGPPPAGDPDFPLFRASFFAPRSPHVIVRLKEYVVLDDRAGGTGHGSPNEYDRHVPVAFLGTGIAKGRNEAACGPEDVAPTLAALLGLEYPLQDAQRLLIEVTPR